MPGAKGDNAAMSLDATVEVLAGPQCTFTLKVTKATVTGTDGKVRRVVMLLTGSVSRLVQKVIMCHLNFLLSSFVNDSVCFVFKIA